MTEYASCSRCRRPAPPELNGPPDAPNDDFAEWELFVGAGGDAEEDDVLVCPRCLTDGELEEISHQYDDLDPLIAIPALVNEYESGAIDDAEYQSRLTEQTLTVEALEEAEADDAAAAREAADTAWAKLPALNDVSRQRLLRDARRVLDRASRELRGDVPPL